MSATSRLRAETNRCASTSLPDHEVCAQFEIALSEQNLERTRALLLPIIERGAPYSESVRSAVSKFMQVYLDAGLLKSNTRIAA